MTYASPSSAPSAPDVPRWHVYGCLALLLVGLYVTTSSIVAFSKWRITVDDSLPVAEAAQWKKRSLELDRRWYDGAKFEGRNYNVVGPLFTALSVAGLTLTEWGTEHQLAGCAPGVVHPILFVVFVALPLPFAAFWAFRTVVRSPAWAAVLTACLALGTAVLPAAARSRISDDFCINHLLAVTGLLIIAGDLLGRRRFWLAGIGLCIAAWSRQMTALYAPVLLWAGWCEWRRRAAAAGADGRARSRARLPLIAAVAMTAIAAAYPLTLNTLKFGNPLEFGYRYIFVDRSDSVALDAHVGLFSPRWIPRHARAMNVSFPRWRTSGGVLSPDPLYDYEGASVWLTSPVLLFLAARLPTWWRDRTRRALMLASFLVAVGVMCYCTTDSIGKPYYRYSLDYVPIWLMVLAPYTAGRRSRPFTLACLAYSALYFHLIPPL